MATRISPYEDWNPHKYQKLVMACETRYIVLNCGRRGGKTNVAARKFFKNIMRDYKKAVKEVKEGKRIYKKPTSLKFAKPFLEYWCVAPDYSLVNTQLEELMNVIPKELILKIDASNKEIWLKGFILIKGRSGEKPEKLVSRSLHGCWLDEAAKLKPTVWSSYLSYSMMDTHGWAIFTSTPEGKNWYYEEVITQGQFVDIGGDKEDYKNNKEYRNFYWTSLDNDAKPEVREDALKKVREMPRRYVLREIYARVDTFFGQVYENLDPEVHTISDSEVQEMINQNQFESYYIFKDWGFKNWGVSLVVGRTSNDYFVVVEEVYKNRINDYPVVEGEETWFDIDEALIKKYKNVKLIIADSAEPKAIQAYRKLLSKKKLGVQITEADKDVNAGIKCVSSFLFIPDDAEEGYIPKLRINKKCKNLVRELTAYKWKDNGLEEVVKKDDHGPDALRYGIYTLSKKPKPSKTFISKQNRNKYKRKLGW